MLNLSEYHFLADWLVISRIASPGDKNEWLNLVTSMAVVHLVAINHIYSSDRIRNNIEGTVHTAYCQGDPSFLLIKYPLSAPSLKMGDN